MGGKAHGGRRVSHEEGMRIGDAYVMQALADGAISFGEVCGSLRREKPEAGDVDIVVVPTDKFEPWARERFGMLKNGNVRKGGLIEGVQVDVLAIDDGGLGAALMHYTGSKETNIVMRRKAIELGLKLNEKGLWEGGTRLECSRFEREVYERLEMPFQTPEER